MFLKSFTSPHGIEMVDAVFEVSTSMININDSESFDYRISEGLGDSSRYTNSSGDKSLQYQMYYWKDSAARDAFGADPTSNLPMILANVNPMGEWFYVTGADITEEYLVLTAEQMAEKHCQEVVLL